MTQPSDPSTTQTGPSEHPMSFMLTMVAAQSLLSAVKSKIEPSCATVEQALYTLQARSDLWPKQKKESTADTHGANEWDYFSEKHMISMYFLLLNTLTTEEQIKPFEGIFENIAKICPETEQFVSTELAEEDPNNDLFESTIGLLSLPGGMTIRHTPALATLINKIQGPSASSNRGRTDITQLLLPFFFRPQQQRSSDTKMTEKEKKEAEEEEKVIQQLSASDDPEKDLYQLLVSSSSSTSSNFSPSQPSIMRILSVIKQHRQKKWSEFIQRVIPLLIPFLTQVKGDGEMDRILPSSIVSALCLLTMMCVEHSDPDDEDEPSSSSSSSAPSSSLICPDVFSTHNVADAMFSFFTASPVADWAAQYAASSIAFLYPSMPLPVKYAPIVPILKDFVNVVRMGFMPTIVASAGMMTLVTNESNHPLILADDFLSKVALLLQSLSQTDDTRIGLLLSFLCVLHKRGSHSTKAAMKEALPSSLLEGTLEILKKDNARENRAKSTAQLLQEMYGNSEEAPKASPS